MPAPDVQLYLFYLGCVVVACLVISVTTFVVRRRRRTAFRREILRSVLGQSQPSGQPVPDARSSSRSVSHPGRGPFGRLHRPGGRPEPIPSERKQKWEEARKLAQSGWTVDQIVSHLKLGYDEARIALLGSSVTAYAGRDLPEHGPSKAAKALRLAEEGMSPAEIGKRLGMSLQEVELISHVA